MQGTIDIPPSRMNTSACPFCRIAAADAANSPALLQNKLAVAFLDIGPFRPGHALVIPRRHEPDYWSMTPEEHQAVAELAQRLSQAQKALFNPVKVSQLVLGFDVPHAHVHVVPLQRMSDLDFSTRPPMATAEQLAEVRQRYAAWFAAN